MTAADKLNLGVYSRSRNLVTSSAFWYLSRVQCIRHNLAFRLVRSHAPMLVTLSLYRLCYHANRGSVENTKILIFILAI